jgi:hypothetical protein
MTGKVPDDIQHRAAVDARSQGPFTINVWTPWACWNHGNKAEAAPRAEAEQDHVDPRWRQSSRPLALNPRIRNSCQCFACSQPMRLGRIRLERKAEDDTALGDEGIHFASCGFQLWLRVPILGAFTENAVPACCRGFISVAGRPVLCDIQGNYIITA